ncbi:hypothetical protein P9272_04035 [Mesorhizobium sp. WSM4976]|jgi:hypothetical protein|uniref:hypothetical protein n=1 Tax=Mesorhizobium sp. WSM4976 TaxID=3038549 RepID=UPI002417D3CF|nr:hypothetical protein [Mesorhizobium sp. WSM4976]MDG4892751.1 hypothetical protein [Mesorhizobium sp. WSM4976]
MTGLRMSAIDRAMTLGIGRREAQSSDRAGVPAGNDGATSGALRVCIVRESEV